MPSFVPGTGVPVCVVQHCAIRKVDRAAAVAGAFSAEHVLGIEAAIGLDEANLAGLAVAGAIPSVGDAEALRVGELIDQR